MDFQAISNIFGGSIFPQDYRVDVPTAREKISELKKTYVSDSGSSKGQILLVEAVLCSITGEFAKYESLLRKAKEVADSEGDDVLSLRCYVYLKYSQWLIRASPPLDFWSDWKAQTEDFDEIFLSYRGLWSSVGSKEGLDIMKKFNDWLWDSSEGCVWPEIECRVLFWFWRLTYAMWGQGYHHHPDYPCDYVWTRLGDVYKGMVDMNWAAYEFTQTKRKLPKTATFLKRLMAEGHLAGIDPDQTSIASLIQDCKDQGDQIGVANLELIKGDRIYSHPWTSPIALNLMLHASDLAWNNEFEGSCKKTESRRPEDAFQKAESCYKKAFQIFEKEGCRRGMGASTLRSACIRSRKILDAIDCSTATFSSTESSTEDMFNETFQLLQEALDLFEFDEVNINIVRIHELLLDIFQGSDLNEIMLQKAGKIGMWGRENGNPRISRFAGMLLLRAGKMILSAPKFAKSTRACVICAQFVFNRLREPLMEGRAVASQALMYRELGNLFLAREKVMMSCNVLLNARQWFLCAVRLNDQKRFARLWNKLAESYKERFTDIFKRNSHQLKEWKQKLSELRGCCSLEHQGDHLIEKIASIQPISTNDQNVAQDWFRAEHKSSEDKECRKNNFESHLRHREAIMKHSANTDLADSELGKILRLSADGPEHLWIIACKIVALMHQCKFDESRKLNFDLLPNMLGGRGSNLAQLRVLNAPKLMIDATLENYLDAQTNEAQLAVQMCYCVQDWKVGETVLVKASEHNITILDFENDKSSDACELSIALAAIRRNTGYSKDAFQLYMLALNRIEQNNKALSDVEDRMSNIAPTFIGEAFSGLASIYLECNDSTLDEVDHTEGINVLWNHFGQGRKDRALSCLEQGRSRVLLDLLGLEGNTLAYRTWLYNERLSQIDNERMSAESQRPVLQGSDGDYRLIEAEIKREDDMIYMASALSKAHLNQHLVHAANPYEFIPQNSVAISINVTTQNTIVFYITSVGIQRYHLGSLTWYELIAEVSGFLRLFRRLKSPSSCPEESFYRPCLKSLSDLIIQPAEDIISRKSHVIFLVSQPLNKFPLSALYFENKPLFLSKEVSSCPSLTVLQNLTMKAKRRNNYGDKQFTSMVFTAPPDSEQVEIPTTEPLDMSAASMMHMSSQFECEMLAAQKLTPEEFGRTFSKSDVMLIATHGRQPNQARLAHSSSSWEYAVLLGSGSSFRVVDLLKWESQAALVIFEACISGLVEDSGANESVGFSHMVLACGANAYLGAMWEVSDQASALLMYFFFKELAMARKDFGNDGERKRKRKRTTLASCLQRAQIALYNTDKEAAMKLLGEFQKSCQHKGSGDGLSDRQRKMLCDSLEFAMEDMDDENPDGTFLFRNAFFHAPFMLVGNGALEV